MKIVHRAERVYFSSREKQLAILHGCFQNVIKGSPQIVLIPGLSGQGKTTLVQVFVQQIQEQFGKNSLPAMGIGSNPTSPYHIWYDALSNSLGGPKSEDNVSQEKSELVFDILKKFAPELLETIVSNLTAGWSDVAVLTYKSWNELKTAVTTGTPRRRAIPVDDEDTSEENILFGRGTLIKNQFERFSQAGLTPIICLDDIQLADSSSIYLIDELARSSIQPNNKHWPFLLIIAYRSNEIRMRLGARDYHKFRDIERELCNPKYNNIVVPIYGLENSLPKNLPGISIHSYVENRFKRHNFSQDLISQIEEWTDGEAQFVHELFNLWELNGKIIRDLNNRSWIVTENLDLSEFVNWDYYENWKWGRQKSNKNA